LTAELRELAGEVMALPARELVLDGEVVVPGTAGRGDRNSVREQLAKGNGSACDLVAFDVVHVDGWDLHQTLQQRLS
jgi:bifunctional non-homologous end joining protein LigD